MSAIFLVNMIEGRNGAERSGGTKFESEAYKFDDQNKKLEDSERAKRSGESKFGRAKEANKFEKEEHYKGEVARLAYQETKEN